jgi:hypothetical protein
MPKTIMENTFKIELASKLPHEQRVIVEANELGIKTFALKTFIDSNPIFEKLEMDEKERLHLQYNLMKSYWEILEKRIQNFKDLISDKKEGLTFEEAEKLLKIGECIALSEWKGFWFGSKKGELLVLTKDGDVLYTPHELYKERNDWKVVTPTAEQLSRIKNHFDSLPIELTFGQKLVGLTLNPSGDDNVGKVKQLFADVLDAIGDPAADTERRSYSFNIIRTQAINTTMLAQMAVVKFLTWRE